VRPAGSEGLAVSAVTARVRDDSSPRRVVVLPGLWAPLHHRAAVAALTAFVGDTRPDLTPDLMGMYRA
jgi:hypothetical protein